MSERVRVMLSEEEVDRRIQEIGEQISKDYEGRQVHLVQRDKIQWSSEDCKGFG